MTERPGSQSAADRTQRAQLADSVAAFTGRGTDTARARALLGTNEYDSAPWRHMAELGWLGILVPETHGGLGLGLPEMGIVARGLARALAPEPLVASAVMATTALASGSNEALKRKHLPDIVAGEVVPVLACQETAGAWGDETPTLRALQLEGGYRLNGVKRFIAGASQATAFLVYALDDAKPVLFWVARDTAGVRLELHPLADGRQFGTLTLTDAMVSQEHVIARGAQAADTLARALDYGTAIASAELCGVAERAFEISLDYLKTRVQFGKPIGSFQALQHRAVDLYIEKELAGAALDQVLEVLGDAPDAASRAALASRLKARCSDAALRIAREAIQLHGAIGFTDECDVGLYLKRALVLAVWLGSATQHRRRYAALNSVNRES